MKRKRTRILMSFCTDWYWYDVAKNLSTQLDLAYLVSRPAAIQSRAAKELKTTVVLNQNTLEYPFLVDELNKGNTTQLSQSLLESLNWAELEFLAISDRVSFFPLTVRRRRAIFKSLVQFWYTFLKKEKLDAIFLTDTPHVGFDTVLFAVATTCFKIPVVSLRRPFIRDRMLLVSDYRSHLPKVPTTYKKTANKKELNTLIGAELIADVLSENPWQKKDALISHAAIKQPSLLSFLIARVTVLINPLKWYSYVNSLFSPSTYGAFNFNNGTIKLVEKICGLYHRYSCIQLKKHYDTIAHDFKLPTSHKYIYFPLHLQPERSTIPEGGIFEDQRLAIEILAQAIPNNWRIVVKEHPRQINLFDFQKHTFRTRRDYDELKKIDGVIFCPLTVSQTELIAQAECTATITGTGGWESLLANKPSLVFGNAWYSGCQSCFSVSSLDQVKHALSQLKNKSQKIVELDLLRFLAYYRNDLIVGSNAKEFALQSPRKYQHLVENMTKSVTEHIQNRL